MRKLAVWALQHAGRADVADAFAVARQFCLRVGSELVPLGDARHSLLLGDDSKTPIQVCIKFLRRKGHGRTPDYQRRLRAHMPATRANGLAAQRACRGPAFVISRAAGFAECARYALACPRPASERSRT